MRDIADLVFEEPLPAAGGATPALPSADSPLRPWGMWGGWGALGLACAGAVAHGFSRLRHRPVTESSRR